MQRHEPADHLSLKVVALVTPMRPSCISCFACIPCFSCIPCVLSLRCVLCTSMASIGIHRVRWSNGGVQEGRCAGAVSERIAQKHARSSNGEGGIRTHGDPEATPVFKTGAFNRSATSPGDSGPLQAGAAWYRGIAELVIRRRRSTKENSPALDGASGIGLRRQSWMSPNAESASRSSRRRRRPQDAGQDAETQASQQRDDRWPPGGGGKTAGDHDAGEGAEAAGRRRGALTIAE